VYLDPSFSSSAMTQSDMQGVHLARRQSIIDLYISSCVFIEGKGEGGLISVFCVCVCVCVCACVCVTQEAVHHRRVHLQLPVCV
jgi:hypothetical protein